MEFDYKKLTLDGKPMTSEDVSLIVAQYHNMHPEDELWKHVIDLIVGSNYTGSYGRGMQYCLTCRTVTKHIRVKQGILICTDHT